MMKEFVIALSEVSFHAHHGVLPVETKTGNEFIVDLEVVIPYKEEILDDDLAATISYADLYELVAEEMGKPRKLLETVAATILKRMKERWPEIMRGCLTICKSTPPIPGITGSAKVTLIF